MKGTENEWLIDLLFAFNSGDVAKFRALKPKWSSQPDLAAHETLLFEKVLTYIIITSLFLKICNFKQIIKQ